MFHYPLGNNSHRFDHVSIGLALRDDPDFARVGGHPHELLVETDALNCVHLLPVHAGAAILLPYFVRHWTLRTRIYLGLCFVQRTQLVLDLCVSERLLANLNHVGHCTDRLHILKLLPVFGL